MEVKIMFKKILSLIIIALMLLSVIGFSSAGQVRISYPKTEPNGNVYRYTTDEVYDAAVYYPNDSLIETWADYEKAYINGLGINAHVLIGRYNPANSYLYYNNDKVSPGDIDRVNTDVAVGQTLLFWFWGDHTWTGSAFLEIRNYDGSDFYIYVWDRGYARDPHINVIYKGVQYDGKDGDDLKINA
jgi:hypothetical protein